MQTINHLLSIAAGSLRFIMKEYMIGIVGPLTRLDTVYSLSSSGSTLWKVQWKVPRSHDTKPSQLPPSDSKQNIIKLAKASQDYVSLHIGLD